MPKKLSPSIKCCKTRLVFDWNCNAASFRSRNLPRPRGTYRSSKRRCRKACSQVDCTRAHSNNVFQVTEGNTQRKKEREREEKRESEREICVCITIDMFKSTKEVWLKKYFSSNSYGSERKCVKKQKEIFKKGERREREKEWEAERR